LIFGVLTHIVPTALLFVAGVAEVSIAPAKPLSYAAAELALELYEILAVFRTVLDWDVTASRTDQLFRFEGPTSCVRLVHGSNAILSASEVGRFAFEAHEIGIYDHGILLWLAKIRGGFVFEFGVVFL
jgi:hypothetical protein